MAEKDNIVLIGMPGAGKSTLGIVLAKILCMDFVDADLLIQQSCDKSLQRLIDTLGPDAFLEIENQVLSEMSFEHSVIATGGSAIDAITIVKKSHPKSIKFLCVIAAPEGLQALTQAHPDVQIYCASVDEKLNENGYILPGLGDAGDRIFGTI